MRFDIICITFVRLIFMDLNPCRKRLGVSRGSFGRRLGTSWEAFGVVWGPLGDVLGGLGRSLGLLGTLGAVLGASWGRLGGVLVANMAPTWLPKRSQNRLKIETKNDLNFDAS